MNQYDYLMKAMLAHGASHLDLHTGSNFKAQGLKHRIEAMSSLNKALSTFMVFVMLTGEDVLQQEEARQVIVCILEAIVSLGPQKDSQQCLDPVQK